MDQAYETEQQQLILSKRIARDAFHAAHPELRDANLHPVFADILAAHASIAVIGAAMAQRVLSPKEAAEHAQAKEEARQRNAERRARHLQQLVERGAA